MPIDTAPMPPVPDENSNARNWNAIHATVIRMHSEIHIADSANTRAKDRVRRACMSVEISDSRAQITEFTNRILTATAPPYCRIDREEEVERQIGHNTNNAHRARLACLDRHREHGTQPNDEYRRQQQPSGIKSDPHPGVLIQIAGLLDTENRLLYRDCSVSNVDHVEYVGHEHRKPIPADMKLCGIVSLGEDSPFLRQLMAIDVSEPGDLPHDGGKLSLEEFKNVIALELTHDDRGGDVVKITALRRAIELNGQAAPSLNGGSLLLRFEHGFVSRSRFRAGVRRRSALSPA